MSFNTNSGRAEYSATAGQTLFTYVFKAYTSANIKVYLTPAGQEPSDITDLLTETTDYVITIDGDSGGIITLVAPTALNDAVTFVRDLENTRSIEYQELGDLFADTLNTDQDYQTYLIADQETNNNRFLSIPQSAQGVSTELPDVTSDSYLKWNSAGDGIENDTTIPDAVTTSAENAAAALVSADASEVSRQASGVSAVNSEDSNLESESWANEDEDVAVKEYSSGIPSDRVPEVFSAKHYAAKADLQASTELWNPLTITHNITTDADYTLTAEQNKYGRIIITDTGVLLTTARNIITDNIQKSFVVQNDTAQDLTFKTSGGTGILVEAGTFLNLYNDGINVIINEHIGIGVKQTWQDLTVSRSGGVTYTNTSDKPIEVKVSAISTANGNNVIILIVDGINIDRVTTAASGAGFYVSIGAIIPVGSTYEVTIAGVSSLNIWNELRGN